MSAKKLVVGFDGFIDTITKAVLQTDSSGKPALFHETIATFGEYIKNQANKSCSIELDVLARRLGGNSPLLARGAASLGMDVTLIGMLGEHEIDEAFSPINAKMYTYAKAGESTALEFDDGKIFLAPNISINGDVWDLVNAATDGAIEEILIGADCLALVNWSEVFHSHYLWEKVCEVLKKSPVQKDKYVLFDLCDCKRKPYAEIVSVLELIGAFSKTRTTVLSLNENEALIVSENGELNEIGRNVRSRYGIDEVLIHTTKKTLLETGNGLFEADTIYVEAPLISTGAGDNFNACYCCGLTKTFDERQRIEFCHNHVYEYLTKGI